MRISKAAAALITLLAGTFWFYSRQPLHHTDLWGHLSYGRWIAQEGRLPATEPFMPLAHGVAVVDTAWLAQLVAYGVETAGGFAGLQFLYAGTVAVGCGLLVGGMLRTTKRLVPALVVWGAFLALEWFQLRIIRPQIAGIVGFVLVEVLLQTRRGRRAPVWLIPLVFVVWANAHGSFITGLGLLATSTLGRAFDVARRRWNWRDVRRDPRLRRLVGITVLSSLAVLINPYGPRLYVEVLTFARNPNLRDLIEWTPLDFGTWQGQLFAATFVLLAATTLIVRRKWSAFYWLPLAVFGVATVCSARMIVWWGPLAAWCLAEQADRAMRRRRFHGGAVAMSAGKRVTPTSSGAWSVVALVAVCLAIVASPLGRSLFHDGDREPQPSLSARTPVAAVEWLRSHPPLGQVFNAYEWGDYLVWAGPPGVAVFVTSHVHLIPPEVWRDYRAISGGGPDSLDRLDSYRVQVALVDGQKQSRLARRLMADSRWSREYADGHAMIFVRRP